MKGAPLSILASLLLIIAVAATGLAYGHGYSPGRLYGPHHDQPYMHMPGMGYDDRHHGPGHRMWSDGERRLMHFARHLDLTDDQRDAIREIFDSSRTKKRELRDAMRDNRRAMADAMRDEGYGPEFERLAERQGGLIADLIALRAETYGSIQDLLTEDQRERLRSSPFVKHFEGY